MCLAHIGWLPLVLLSIASPVFAQHSLWLQGAGKLVRVDRDGKVAWEKDWGGVHDLHVLNNGNVMVQQGGNKVVEIDTKTKEIVWTYDSGKSNGNDGKPVEVHAFQPLADGKVMIAESGPGRIIEVDRAGNLTHEIKLKVNHPHPHTDTRLARKLESGNYLVCHEGDGFIREYDPAGKVVWEYEVPMFGKEAKGGHGPEAFGNKAFAALRQPNGNTLIATGNGHGVIEVTPKKEIVWQIQQNDLPKITLAWVTTLQQLSNGNLLIGNCHAGSGQPLVIELEPKTKKVVWTFDQHAVWGNDVSNTLAVD